MKKFSYILYGLLFVALFSCEKEELVNAEATSTSSALHGTWHEVPVPYDELAVKREYIFRTDNSFEIYDKVLNSSGTTVGYKQRITGKYTLEGNKLTMVHLQFYESNESGAIYPYEEAIKDLKLSQTKSFEQTVTLEFSDAQNTLKLQFPPCPPNVNCIGFLTLFRTQG